MRKIWNGPTSASGRRLWFGLERGTPLTGLAANNAFPIASTHFQYWIRQNPQFDWHTLSETDFAVKQFARLFLAPGVGHCGGGEGPNPIGVFDALVNWVEKGAAPDTLPATRRRQDGTVVARPLCAYPATARWTGNGSTDDAANFVCADGQHQSGDFRVADPPRN